MWYMTIYDVFGDDWLIFGTSLEDCKRRAWQKFTEMQKQMNYDAGFKSRKEWLEYHGSKPSKVELGVTINY